MIAPTMPVSMSTQPAAWKLKKAGSAVTANARMAPIAAIVRAVAVFTGAVRSLTSPARRVRSCWHRLDQLLPQIGERPGEQPGYVHLGDAELFANLGLGHVAVEAHEQQLLLTVGQLVPVRPDRLHVDHVLQLGVIVAEQFTEACRTVLSRDR